MTDLLVPEGEVWMAAAGLLASRACACVANDFEAKAPMPESKSLGMSSIGVGDVKSNFGHNKMAVALQERPLIGGPDGEKVKAAINRWREHRRQRHVDSREDRIKARENLRDYKPFRGEEYGPPGGYG